MIRLSKSGAGRDREGHGACNSLQMQVERNENGQFLKGHSGNPVGREKGSRNRVTMLAEQIFDNSAEAVIHKAVSMSLEGNFGALGITVRNIIPPRRYRPCQFALPQLSSAADAAPAIAAIAAAAAGGTISPEEAVAFSQVVDTFLRALEAGEVEARLQRLESVNGIIA